MKPSALPWHHILLWPTLIVMITACTYFPSLHYDLQFDDIPNISKHFDIRNYSFSGLFFTSTRWISYWINSIHFKIGRFDPFSYRCGNVLIHILNGILLYLLLFLIGKALYKKQWNNTYFSVMLLTVTLFLLHPVQTQTISYIIQGQLEGLATMAALGIGVCFLLYAQSSTNSMRTFWFISMIILATFASGTKEIAIISPLLLVLIDWFFVAQGSLKELLKRWFVHGTTAIYIIGQYIYFLKPSFFLQALTLQMQAHNNIGNILTKVYEEPINPLHFFISQFKVILHYMWIFLWPFNMSVEYDWKLVTSFLAPDCLIPLIILLILIILIGAKLRRNPIHVIGFGALWFAICILPRSSVIPSSELLVDYKTYMASIGLLFIAAYLLVHGFIWLIQKISRTSSAFSPIAHYTAAGILITTLSTMTIKRNTIWKSSLNFWGDMIKNAPGKARAYNNYGVELAQKMNQYEQAIPYFKQAIAMDDKYPDPLNNLAISYANTGHIDEAIEALYKSLSINPNYPEGYNNLAYLLIEIKDFNGARTALENAIKLRPWYGKAYYNLGRLHIELAQPEKAFEYFKKCCTQADLDNEIGYEAYGKISITVQKIDDARFAYQKMLELNPHSYDGNFGMANVHFLSQNYDQALSIYQKLLAMNPNDTNVLFNIGETYYALGRAQEALSCYQRISAKLDVPQSFIRIAACYEQLGRPEVAKQTLKNLLTNTTNESIQHLCTNLLEQLNQRYPAG